MNRKQITGIINCHYKKLNKGLKKLSKDFDEEAIHDFRVEYKKLRAFLRLLSTQKKSTAPIKISKKLARCYQLAGDIRNRQLQLQHIQQLFGGGLKKPHNYLSLLREEIGGLERRVSKIISKKPVVNSKKDTRDLIPAKFPSEQFCRFSSQKWSEVSNLVISHAYADENIHTIRKNLKDVLYNQEIYEGRSKEFPKRLWKVADMLHYPRLIEEIGNFQDKRAGLALLSPGRLKNLDASERELLNQIKQAWARDKLRMKRLLVKFLEAGIHL